MTFGSHIQITIVPVFFFSFFFSAALTLLLIRYAGRHTKDHDLNGPQKFHAKAVPRVGGVAIYGSLVLVMLGLLTANALGWRVPSAGDDSSRTFGLLMLSGLLIFAVGLWEDITKSVRPLVRLLAAAASAWVGFYLLQIVITRTDIWPLDFVLSLPASQVVGLGVLLTMLAVSGVSNAVNIIDGFNGLASMTAMMMLLGIAYVANQNHDSLIQLMALAGCGAVLGFFIWNYPAGLIFLGDGGAYFLGFYVAELSLLLLNRHPEISPLFPVMLCGYPIFETLFSMYRRRLIRGHAASMPDGIHLHTLFYRRVVRWAVGSTEARRLTQRNSLTATYMWIFPFSTVLSSMAFWDSSMGLVIALLGFVIFYWMLYWKIVRFRTPRWLVLRKHQRKNSSSIR
jgi:UDP-N-acetylmuramyl pentapeptide phosphotransferase/UDP-N-acetylglucosamine-1-phosphate transferase